MNELFLFFLNRMNSGALLGSFRDLWGFACEIEIET